MLEYIIVENVAIIKNHFNSKLNKPYVLLVALRHMHAFRPSIAMIVLLIIIYNNNIPKNVACNSLKV